MYVLLSLLLTLWRPLLPYGYSYKRSCARPSFVIFDIQALWRSGLSVRVPGCQKLQMTGLTRSGTGCFIAVPIWQQWASEGMHKITSETLCQWNAGRLVKRDDSNAFDCVWIVVTVGSVSSFVDKSRADWCAESYTTAATDQCHQCQQRQYHCAALPPTGQRLLHCCICIDNILVSICCVRVFTNQN